MKALRAVDGTNFSWDWDKLIPCDAGIDPIYIENLIDQINNGLYAPLFEGKRDLTFLDIGANLGLVSIYAAPVCKEIYAFEPAPNIRPIIAKLTEPFKNIHLSTIALDAKDGLRQIFVNDINFTASSTVNTYGKPHQVSCYKLSTMLKNIGAQHVDVCKVDCEGAEGEALDYYAIDYAKNIIDTYFIEVHNCPLTSWEHKLGTIVGNLARCGYSKMTIDGMAITAPK